MAEFDFTIDARQYGEKERHAMLFSTLDALKPGQRLELINNQDPKPLRYLLMAEKPGQFDWEYLDQGPEIWRIAITRT